MTVVVAFLCPDGVVVAADSMLTPMIGTGAGPIGVGHHTGRKVYRLPGEQIFGWAGDLGLAARFKTMVELNPAAAGAPPVAPAAGMPLGPRVPFQTPLDYGLLLSGGINSQFAGTKVLNPGDAAALPLWGRESLRSTTCNHFRLNDLRLLAATARRAVRTPPASQPSHPPFRGDTQAFVEAILQGGQVPAVRKRLRGKKSPSKGRSTP